MPVFFFFFFFFFSQKAVPHASFEIIDKELERLEKLGVIEKLTTAHEQLQLYM